MAETITSCGSKSFPAEISACKHWYTFLILSSTLGMIIKRSPPKTKSWGHFSLDRPIISSLSFIQLNSSFIVSHFIRQHTWRWKQEHSQFQPWWRHSLVSKLKKSTFLISISKISQTGNHPKYPKYPASPNITYRGTTVVRCDEWSSSKYPPEPQARSHPLESGGNN